MRKALVLSFVFVIALTFVVSAMNLNYLGSWDAPQDGWTFAGVNVGGISGLTLASDGSFFAVCDDKGKNIDPPGVLYKLDIDFDENGIHGVDVVRVIHLTGPDGKPYEENSIDSEDVLWNPAGFIICSERDQGNNPWIRRFSPDGVFLSEIPVPEKFLPLFAVDNSKQVQGTRTNLSFEASALTPDYAILYVMNEEALVQDGNVATPTVGTQVRLIEYDMSGATPVEKAEYVYITEPMFGTPPEGKSGDNGVPGMVYVGDITSEFDFIVMERSYVSGAGNQIGFFGVKLGNAENVMSLDYLPGGISTISVLEKTQILIISDNPELTNIAFDPDNMEAIALGPKLPNGNYTLIIASDNNFNPKYQRNVFAVLEIVPEE